MEAGSIKCDFIDEEISSIAIRIFDKSLETYFADDSIIILKGKMGKYEQSTNSLTIEQLSKECLVMD